jgi:hypothetical protein
MAFARWFYAPTGRKGIAQGKAKRRPGIRYASKVASPERAERTHGETNARCTYRGRVPTAMSYPAHPGWREAPPWVWYATKVASPERAERTHGEANARCAHRGRAPTRNAGTVPGYSTSKITNQHSTIINPTPRSLRVSGCLKSGQNRIDAWRCSSKHLARKCLTSSRSAC